jgi:diguanylate cyclase (GGDEF)-like protein
MFAIRSANEARRSVRHLRVSVEVPLGHLHDAYLADTGGEALLQRAVAVTGAEREALLSQSIAAAETAAKAWTKYRASALHLPREAALAAKYERDYAAGKAISGSVLVPIVQSNGPAPLPPEQVAAAELDREDLLALESIYEAERQRTLGSLDRQHVRDREVVEAAAAGFGVLLLCGFVLALRAAGRASAELRQRATSAELAEFEARLVRAFEFTGNDEDAFRIAMRALTEVLPDAEVSLVVADRSRTTFTPIGDRAPCCGVDRVELCRVSRGGTPQQFADSDSLDTCPVLAAGASARCAVTCIPVSAAGMQAAVVQLTGRVGSPPEPNAAAMLIVRHLGDRITTMRALAQFQLEASHDPLTELLNRRSLEAAVERLTQTDGQYAVAFADLDHFKLLNDVHGHEAGDDALRAFADTLKTSLRPEDLIARWGGEEFVVVLPNCDQEEAVEALDRVRSRLASEALDGSNVSVTVSVGIAVRDAAESFDRAVARADQALHAAKSSGRDRVLTWSPELDPTPAAP